MVSAIVSCTLNSMESRSSFPDSTLEKSRMSLMTPSRESPDDFSIPRYSRCSGTNSVFKTRSAMPRMPFSGVRISWLMFARNSLLTRLASSAFCFACSSWLFASSSSAVRSSNSIPMR